MVLPRQDRVLSDPHVSAATILFEAAKRLRDAAILEMLYATAVRVSELTGLDRRDVDHRKAMITVLGKGDKERRVPFGAPAQTALNDWLAARDLFAGPDSGDALFLGVRGGRIGARQVRELVHRYGAEDPSAPDIGPARAAALGATCICSTAGPTSDRFRSCSATRP